MHRTYYQIVPMSLCNNYMHLQKKLEKVANSYQKKAPLCLVVSKKQPVESIEALYSAGARDFAESRLQEALEKQNTFNPNDLHWHFIGPLQSNKCIQIAKSFDRVLSVGAVHHAEKLQMGAESATKILPILVQVNISEAPQKSGVLPSDLPTLLSAIKQLPALKLEGLMFLPSISNDPEVQYQQFKACATCFEAAKIDYPELTTLSMGMSGDFEAAIRAGSNEVRLGTVLFGART